MKYLKILLFILLIGTAVVSHAVSQEVQVDLLMSRIKVALEGGRMADALPAFAQLESMAPSLPSPLPESFYFDYLNTLAKNGDTTKVLTRSEDYLNKYGKNGKYYDKVIEIMGRMQVQSETDEKESLRKQAQAKIKEKNCRESNLRDWRATKNALDNDTVNEYGQRPSQSQKLRESYIHALCARRLMVDSNICDETAEHNIDFNVCPYSY